MGANYAIRGWMGSRLRKLRSEAGHSLESLALELGTSATTVSAWEKGRSPRPRRFVLIAKFFHVPTWEFVNYPPGQATLSDLRGHAGLSQIEVCDHFERAGYPRQGVGPIERGVKAPTEGQRKILMELLHIDNEQLDQALRNTVRARAQHR